MADLKGVTCESNPFLESKKIKYSASHDSTGEDDVGKTKIRVSTSSVSDYKQASESLSTDKIHGSTLVHEADKLSSDGTASEQPTSAKSDISVEIGLNTGSFEMDGSNTMTRDSKHRTESSCSNSLSVVLPVSISNQSCQEISKEDYSFSSNSNAVDRLEERLTASSESGVSAQIALKAIGNARAGNSMKISSMVSSSLTKKGEEETSHEWANGAANSIRDEHDNLPTYLSRERTTNSEISVDGENMLAVKGKTLETVREVMGNIKGEANESSESSRTQTSKVSVKDNDTFIAGFDLNEDINANEMDDCVQPVVASVSSHRVIHVVAKAGILNGQPMIPLKFEGGRGWKGSGETSAFRPTRSRNHTPKDSRGFTDIDLNVAAVEDTTGMEHQGISSLPSFQDSQPENDSRHAKSLCFDLNRLYDASDEFTQRALPTGSENTPSVDLNLNANSSMGNKTSHSANPGKRDLSFTIREANNAHTMMVAPHILLPTEVMQRAASLHQKSQFMSHALASPHYYPSTGPFHFGSRDPVPFPFSGIMPYAGYSQEHGGIFPQALNHDTFFTTFGAPHLMQVVHEQNTSERDVKTEDNLSTSRNKTSEARKLSFLARNNPTGETMHQESWYAKRKEPEGGLESYYKKVT